MVTGTEAAAAAPAAAAEPAPGEWLEHVYELHRALELSCKVAPGVDSPPALYSW